MVGAGEALRVALPLCDGERAVQAQPREGAQCALLVAHEQHALAEEVERAVVTGFGQFVEARNGVPGGPQYAFLLEFEEGRVAVATRR